MEKNRQIAELFAAITSAPTGTPIEDAVLSGIGKLVDGRVANWALIAEICDDAAEKAGANQRLAIAFKLGAFNAARRVPSADPAATLKRGFDLVEIIDKAKSEGLLKQCGFLRYQLGVLASHTSDFEEAQIQHGAAMSIYVELGDTPRAAISRFLLAVEVANYALANGTNATGALANLDTAVEVAEKALEGHPWGVNIPAHRMLAQSWWAYHPSHKDYETDIKTVEARDKGNIWGALTESLYVHHVNGMIAETRLEQAVEEGLQNQIVDVWTTAALVLARRLKIRGEFGRARNLYTRLIEWQGLGGRVVKAIAGREILSLPTDE